MADDFLLYGSYGYTGALIAEEALRSGLRPLLAGRDPARVERQAAKLGLRFRVLRLEAEGALRDTLGEVPLVIHAAGPFSRTARPMARACLETGTHYLDITGEISVFEELHGMDSEARDAGVMLLPGAGFDVVPTDCLAAHLARRLPDATHLRLAFDVLRGGISRGTARTALESAGGGGAIRRDGRITTVSPFWGARTIDFGRGPVPVAAVPWGDVSTAYHSTGIPNVEVYTRIPPAAGPVMRFAKPLTALLRSRWAKAIIDATLRLTPPGPTPRQRTSGTALLWGEVENASGTRAHARMSTPEAYTLTAAASVEIARRALGGAASPGFQTPSLAFGPDWILELPGVSRSDG